MICPCCGSKMPYDIKLLLKTVPLGPAERKLAEHYAGRFGQFIAYEQTNDFFYADRADGGPDNVSGVIKVLTNHLNKKLRPLGVAIEGGMHWGGRRMVWTE